MVKAAVKEKGRGMNAATAGSSADRKKRRYEQCTDPTVELVKKMKKDVERNKLNIKHFYNPKQSIVDKSGSLVVSASAIDRIVNGMMEASALDFFLKIVQVEAHYERIAIFPINFMQKILDHAINTNRMFQRYEQKNGWEDIFHEADQLHFPILHSAHYSVISIAKLQKEHTTSDCDYYHRIYTKCSLGRDMDHLVRQLLTAIESYYESNGKQFNHDQFYRPMGRGAKRCAKQADNGLNCGLFVCFNVEMMTKIKVNCPTFCNDDGPMYRNHMLLKIMQFVETHNGDYSMLEVTARNRAGGKRVRAKPQLIDLTGGDLSDEE